MKALKSLNQEIRFLKDSSNKHKKVSGRDKNYDATKYKNEKGEYDFTKAPGYNEDVVRYNINKVKHPPGMVIIAPTAVKEIIFIPPTNFVTRNIGRVRGRFSKVNEARM